MAEALWKPSAERIASSNLTAYQDYLHRENGLQFASFHELYNWSVNDISAFWESIWKYGGFLHSQSYKEINQGPHMWDNHWFSGVRLNFAANLLRFRDNRTAIICWHENGQRCKYSFRELHDLVAACACGLRNEGVQKGDRVAAYITNIAEAVIMMLATTSLGAIWTSCSPDFGLQGVIDRFKQVEPKILLAVDSYTYAGKEIDRSDVISQLASMLPSLQKIVVVNRSKTQKREGSPSIVDWDNFLCREIQHIEFVQYGFDHPIYILYSSGTTGAPKCIVHGAGGTLLQHFKEHAFHCDLKERDVISYYTTCGWMMWNWLVSALYHGSTIFLYDGSPAHPSIEILWDAVDTEKINIFGTSPRYLQACETAGNVGKMSHNLSSLKAILSTGSPLPEHSFDWVYDKLKSDVQLASISGGTDIVSCFMLGCPTLPVYRGEIQTRGLGMKVETFDETGHPITNEVGELVCTAPFPSRPVCFWNDPDGSKYKSAYFEHFPGVWRHGDYIKITETGGIIVYGRSDATLNRAGVRIGTAEIYSPVEALAEISDSLVVERADGRNSEIILFVVMEPGFELDPDLVSRIKSEIRTQASPRHVPDRIIAVSEIPRTVSGKKVEMAVTNILNGRPVANRNALANPEALLHFESLALDLSTPPDRV